LQRSSSQADRAKQVGRQDRLGVDKVILLVLKVLRSHDPRVVDQDVQCRVVRNKRRIDRPAVARYLVERGCRTDILLASTVGDIDRVRSLLDADPECIRVRSNKKSFPMDNKEAGASIYQWSLGPDASPYQAAAKFGHQDVKQSLL
jgi:hypothetical protein